MQGLIRFALRNPRAVTVFTLTVLLLGVGVATAAPLFTVRRLRRTDIPSTLRVLE